jgi:ubiquinone/menaquinone biosynthesis C-methylase UbiE
MSEYDATQAFYGRWARLYDRLATAPGIRSWRQRTADVLALEPGDTVVEMGVGTGANLPALRERVGVSGHVVGLDLTRGMLDVAARRVAAAGWGNVHLVRADARSPPIAGGVDAVLGSFVVGMFADPAAVVGTWLDCLAPGGRLALLDAARSDRALARPLNAGLRAFVRLTSPGGGPKATGDDGPRPIESLETRIDAADGALAAGTATAETTRLAGGFVRLRWGRTPE